MRVLDAGRWMLSTDRVDCHPLSTMTRDSFHVYSWTFRSFVLILFHAYERSHRGVQKTYTCLLVASDLLSRVHS